MRMYAWIERAFGVSRGVSGWGEYVTRTPPISALGGVSAGQLFVAVGDLGVAEHGDDRFVLDLFALEKQHGAGWPRAGE